MTVTISQFIGEVLGSFTLVALGVGVSMNLTLKKSFNQNNLSAVSGPLGWGFAVAMAIIVSMPFQSGAHFNPAVSIGFAAAGLFDWAMVIPYICAQCIGSLLGAVAIWFIYKCHFDATSDEPGKLLGVFATNASIRNPVRNFACEVLATFFLVFVSMSMISPSVHMPDGQNIPLGLGANGALINGFLIFTIGISFGGVTGWSLNPTRDLMPRLAHQVLPIKGKGSSDWGYGIRNGALAPIVGGLLGAVVYLLVKDYIV